MRDEPDLRSLKEEERYPLLERLCKLRILSVSRTEAGQFNIEEACDNYFAVDFSPEELAALGRELIEMAAAQATAGSGSTP